MTPFMRCSQSFFQAISGAAGRAVVGRNVLLARP
jgi:hypothetical protein